MRVFRSLDRVPRGDTPRVMTVGSFDGVHLAHQAICARVVERARALGAQAMALTFHPHPAAILSPQSAPPLLIPFRERLRLLRAAGLDQVVVQPFSPAFSQLDADAFVRRYLVERLSTVHVVVGHTVRFGRGRRGDQVLLRRLGQELGFGVDVVGPIAVGEQVVSSSVIRAAVAAGDVPLARQLLGHDHFACGRVEHGQGRGVQLGFPTANLRVRVGLLPANGVYAVRVSCGAGDFGGMANLGVNPTFGLGKRSLEAHLFDFDGDLYGQRLTVHFVVRLRDERKFPSAARLVEQIQRDAAAARQALRPA